MSEVELNYFRKVLSKMEKHKQKNPTLYIDDEYEYLMKEEIKVTNDVYKGVILFKNKVNYLIDIYIGDGDGNIITGLLSKQIKDYDRALNSYTDNIDYIKNNEVMDILKNGEKNFKI